MKKCNKGFTLVELLVTISILGLITAMSMPIIRNIIEANTLKKYITYIIKAITIVNSCSIIRWI